MLLAGRGVSLHRHGDVIHREHEMIFRRYVARPLDAVDQPQQRHDMACAGLVDRGVQAREGADVDHEGQSIESMRLIYDVRAAMES
jgi:hypothetical protein